MEMNINLYELPQLYDRLFQKYAKGKISNTEMELLNVIESTVDQLNKRRKTRHM